MSKPTQPTGTEVRCMDSTFAVETREDGTYQITGYALKFNTTSQDLGGWKETILPGACDEVLSQDVRALFNHDKNMILGRTTADPTTLSLEVDGTGLRYTINPPATSYAKDLAISIQRGDITGSSFTFNIAPGGTTWVEAEDGTYLRQVTKLSRLHDVGPVTFPAYLDTSSETAKRELDHFREMIDYSKKPDPAISAAKRQRSLDLKSK